MLLHDLNEDVLVEILSYCDVYTALSTALVNKDLRVIALAKQLWISFLRDLESRGMIDLAPGEEFEKQTTQDLIDEVKRIVLGPKTWSPAWSAPPVLKRQSVLPFECESSGSGILDIRLLPGGRYFAVHQGASLKFFDAATGKSALSYTHSDSIHYWSIDMSAGIHTGVLILVGPDIQNVGSNTNALDVVEVNLKSGQSDTLTRCPLPTTATYLSPVVLGDFFAISFELEFQAPGLVLVVNWRSDEYVLLNCDRPLRTTPVLVPTHLAITHEELDASHTQMLLVYAIASFTPFWRSVREMGIWDRVYSRQLSPVACERLAPHETPIRHCQFVDLTAYASPLRSDTYEFRLHTVDRIPRPQKRTFAGFIRRGLGRAQNAPPQISRSVLFFYRLDLSGPHPGLSTWRFLSSERIHGCIRARSLSFSRYCLDRTTHNTIMDALVRRDDVDEEDGGPRAIVLHPHVGRTHYLSPYSGAVVSLTPYSLTVSYAL
ncbi:hypothetical protein DFH09DRAFT_1179015 [Mycena vulgaris]|nr:hypothetical protein DFH09DRAFT_1179015 [Mycena vulgaris]